MALKSGLAAQLGVIDEVSYGLPVTVSRFYPFVSENVNQIVARMEAKSILAGRRTVDATQWLPGAVTVTGSVSMELYDHTMGFWLRQAFGGYAVSGSGPYTQTYTPGDMTGKSFTMQIGRPDVGTGTVRPFTYAGTKVTKWTLSAQANSIATLVCDVVAQTEQRVRTVSDAVTSNGSATLTSATAVFTLDDVGSLVASAGITAGTTILSVQSATSVTLSANATGVGTALTIGVPLATASYGTLNPVSYVSGVVTIGGAVVPVKSISVVGDNKLDVARQFVGSRYVSEPLEADRRTYTINFDPEFTDYVIYNRFPQGTTAALSLVLASGANTYTVTSNVRFDNGTPNVAGPKILDNSMVATAVGATDAAAITVVTVNSDTVY